MNYEAFYLSTLAIYILLFISLLLITKIKNRSLEKYIYLILSLCCIFVVVLRPYGISPDDINYDIHQSNACSIIDCGINIFEDYDIGYFFLLSITKVFFDDFHAILNLAGIALGIKLFLIARITNNSVLSLYLYFSISFLYHDIIQFRSSVAISCFLIALYLIDQKKIKLGVAAHLISISMHYQAIISPLVHVVNKIIQRKYQLGFTLVIITQLAGIINLTPPIFLFEKIMFINDDQRVFNSLNIGQDTNFRIRGTNILIILYMLTIIKPLKAKQAEHNIYEYCFNSLIMGYMLYWIFWNMPGFSDRILQFFWVPIAILASFGREYKSVYVSTITTGMMFFILTFFIAPIITKY